MEENKTLAYPYEFTEVTPEEQKQFDRLYDVLTVKALRVGPKGYVVYKPFIKDAANIYNMPIRPTDIYVNSYQRSGTTWTQELVWLVANDLDYTKAKKPLFERYAFLDGFMFLDEDMMDTYAESLKRENENVNEEEVKNCLRILCQPVSGMLAKAPSPRFIKTHLPLSLMNPKLLDTAKVVYVARDPRDVAVSCYHQAMLFRTLQFPNGFKDLWNIFYTDLFTLLPYFEHVKEAWEKRHHPNMLFLFYEEMSKDLPAVIRRVGKFFGKELNQEQMDQLCDHLNFENFRNNKSVNLETMRIHGFLGSKEKFIRKGKTGGWRNYFDEEMTKEADEWIEKNLRDTDLRFPNM